MKKKIFPAIQYIIVFAGFLAMYFFIIPNSDNYYFSRTYENNISSIIHDSLHYGNGRLAGNLIGIGFNQNFIFGFLVVAVTLTLLVYAINKFFFDGNAYTVMPTAIIIAFPNMRFISDIYEQVATIANYVFPIALFFCALCFIKKGEKDGKPVINGIPAFIITAVSCLCSENTTVSIFTAAVLLVIYGYIGSKKVSLSRVFLAAGAGLGSLIMLLIPKLVKSTEKLDSYRGTASSVSSLIKQCFVNLFTFSDVFSSLAPIAVLVSAGLIIALLKKSEADNRLKTVLISSLAALPVEFIVYTVYAKNSPYSIYMYTVQTIFVILYALCLLASILSLNKSDIKTVSLGFYILILSSVGPMMIVNICGYRTFYHTFIILLSFGIYLLKKTFSEYKKLINKIKQKKIIKNACTVALSVVFLGMSANIFVLSVYNYNYYVERTNCIADAINNRESVVEISPVPCYGISNEDEFPSLLDSILFKYEGYHCEFKMVVYGSDTGNYYSILETNPFSSTVNALKHLNYKNIEIMEELTNVK